MDGVITDTMPIHLKAWQEAFRPCGISVDKMDVYLRGRHAVAIMAREIAKEKGVRLRDEDLDRIVAEKTRIFDSEAKPTPGIRGCARNAYECCGTTA